MTGATLRLRRLAMVVPFGGGPVGPVRLGWSWWVGGSRRGRGMSLDAGVRDPGDDVALGQEVHDGDGEDGEDGPGHHDVPLGRELALERGEPEREGHELRRAD